MLGTIFKYKYALQHATNYTCPSNPCIYAAPADYLPLVNVVLEFPAQMCIDITIIDDGLIEPIETFVVSLTSTDSAVIVDIPEAQVEIISVLAAPIGLEEPAYTVNENAGQLQVCVIANGTLTEDVEVALLSQEDSATG